MKQFVIAAALFACAPAFAAQPTTPSEHPSDHQMKPADSKTAKDMGHSDQCGLPMGEGVVTALDVAKARATINHEPIPAIGWDEMTMPFAVDKSVDLAAFAAGDRVHFLLAPDKKAKGYTIASMCAADADAGAHQACMTAMHKTAMKVASDAGKPCSMEGMDHDSMDHGSMDHGSMDHGAKKKDAASGDHVNH